MEPSALFAFFLAVAAVTAAPGPLVAILAARTLVRDLRGALAFAAGICLGDVVVIALICSGLGAWSNLAPEALAAGRWIGAGYLAWMAIRMWHTSPQASAASAPRRHALVSGAAGLVTCLSSPQTVVFYLLLLPGVVELERVGTVEVAVLAMVSFAALAAVFAGVMLAAGRAQRLLSSPSQSRACTRCMALSVAGTAIWILVV